MTDQILGDHVRLAIVDPDLEVPVDENTPKDQIPTSNTEAVPIDTTTTSTSTTTAKTYQAV
jgi:hypothetical protein